MEMIILDYKKYMQMIEVLKSSINEKVFRPEKFKVYNYEAGIGKSRETINIVKETLGDLKNMNRYLIVKRFSREVVEAERYLEEFNSTTKLNVLGITSENWGSKWKNIPEKLIHIRVIIITHQRYINLCLDDELRKYFQLNRNVLIIDEKVNFPNYTYSKKLYDEVRGYLDNSIQEELDKVCKKLNEQLEKFKLDKKENACIRTKVKLHPKTLANFLSLMEANRNNPLLKGLTTGQRNNLDMMIEGLPLWYSNNNIYNNGRISTYNPKHCMWGLKNNIILDASAGIDKAYRNREVYTIFEQDRLIDHSNSVFNILEFNSSKSNLKLNENEFYPEICSLISDYHMNNDKTLIICHKQDAERIELELHRLGINSIGVNEKYTDQDYSINWFGNLIGRNDYSDFNQCWILGTPNIPYEQYLLQYMMYNRNELGRKSLDILKGRFKNEELKFFQTGYIAAELYQSIKRIQRNELPRGGFFIVNSDREIVEAVLSQIKGSTTRKELKLSFKENKNSSKVVAPDRVERLIEFIQSLSPGNYTKSEITKELGFEKSNFGKLLKDSRFKAFEKTGCVRINTRVIQVI